LVCCSKKNLATLTWSERERDKFAWVFNISVKEKKCGIDFNTASKNNLSFFFVSPVHHSSPSFSLSVQISLSLLLCLYFFLISLLSVLTLVGNAFSSRKFDWFNIGSNMTGFFHSYHISKKLIQQQFHFHLFFKCGNLPRDCQAKNKVANQDKSEHTCTKGGNVIFDYVYSGLFLLNYFIAVSTSIFRLQKSEQNIFIHPHTFFGKALRLTQATLHTPLPDMYVHTNWIWTSCKKHLAARQRSNGVRLQ
jgi:hypothetical protein